MHRPLFIAAFVLLLASAPLYAQRGGGHASAGGHGGGSGSHGSFGGHSFGGHMGGGGHAFSGTHSFSGARSRAFAPRSFRRGSSSHAALSARSRRNSGVGLRLRTYGFRNNCYGYGCGRGGWGYGYPYLGGGLDPYWWWDSGSSYDQDPQTGLANEMDQQGSDEQGNQDLYVRSAPPHPRAPERTEAAPNTVLVFRDQHKQEVQNYAIVGQTLWIFNPQHTQKVPLADLDLDATHKANDERGVDFRLPGAHEGQ